MLIGIPKEIKDNEYRIAMPPNGVRELVRHGHTVRVETSAGQGSRQTAGRIDARMPRKAWRSRSYSTGQAKGPAHNGRAASRSSTRACMAERISETRCTALRVASSMAASA